MSTSFYGFLNHTADLGIWVEARDLSELFANAALALSDLLVECHSDLPCCFISRCLSIEQADLETLLVGWLRELLYVWSVEKRYVARVSSIQLREYRLTATIELDYYDVKRCELLHDIKAVTYHQVEVKPTENGYRAQVIFDV